jgi:hypothetical protein
LYGWLKKMEKPELKHLKELYQTSPYCNNASAILLHGASAILLHGHDPFHDPLLSPYKYLKLR